MSDRSDMVLRFVHFINDHNLKGLGSLLAKDHVYIDVDGRPTKGHDRILDLWKNCFEHDPDYRIKIQLYMTQNDRVIMFGRIDSATTSAKSLLWSVTTVDQLIAEWHVFEDTTQNRKKVGLMA